jgi:hypothetical protein
MLDIRVDVLIFGSSFCIRFSPPLENALSTFIEYDAYWILDMIISQSVSVLYSLGN